MLLAAAAAVLTAALAAQAQVPGVNSTLNSVFTLAYDNSTMKPTYSATEAVFAPATLATDVCNLTGSATKNVRVRRILFNGLATAVISDPVAIIKRSTANSGGTPLVPTPASYDSASAAATAVFTAYTANPTLGTQAGILADPYVTFGNLTTSGPPSGSTLFEFGRLGSPIVLRGVAESVSVNLNVATFTTAQLSCTFEWTEE